MGIDWLGSLLGGGTKGLLEGVGVLAKDLRAAITGEAPVDGTAKAELLLKAQALELAAMQAAIDYDKAQMTGQVSIDTIEAANPSLWNRWRPATGWVCALSFAYMTLLRPLLPWLVAVCGGARVDLPPVDLVEAGALLSGMLGLGTMRSLEKIRGKATP